MSLQGRTEPDQRRYSLRFRVNVVLEIFDEYFAIVGKYLIDPDQELRIVSDTRYVPHIIVFSVRSIWNVGQGNILFELLGDLAD